MLPGYLAGVARRTPGLGFTQSAVHIGAVCSLCGAVWGGDGLCYNGGVVGPVS